MEFTSNNPQQVTILLQIAAAMALGALIGLDREFARKPAGLRTHMLVAGVAAMLIMLGEFVIGQLEGEFGSLIIRTDPIRIIAAIITGVSFLGAGTIIRQSDENHVEGLTTAASILFASVVGIAVALSLWVIAVGATLLVLVVLRILPLLEKLLSRSQDDTQG
jgi:putative Mg2+ transporter-C (MgtC) family protein